MAINVGEALVRIGADASNLPGQLEGARKQTTGWASGVGGAVKGLVGGAVLGAVGIATTAVAGIGAAAAGVATDTQQAQADVRAQFGQTAEEAERTAKLARKAWGDNYGDSIADVANSLGQVQQHLGELGVTSDEEMTRAATNAIALRDTFEVDTAEGISTAKTLMENFGLTSDQAFDFIVEGQQRGLNRSGDFLDTINEYSTQFSNGGASADEFFNLLDSGLQGGMLGTDKAADAFKEFQVRILDGSTTTSDALDQLGINSEEFTSALADGSMTTTEAWNEVVGKLGEVDNEATLMQAGVGLLGTQFEDMGADAVLAMTTTGTSMEDMEGAAESLGAKYTSFGQIGSAVMRRLQVLVAPVADLMLDLANRAMPLLEGGLASIEAVATPVFEGIAAFVDSFISGLEEGLSPIQALQQALATFLPPETVAAVMGFVGSLQQLWGTVQQALAPILEAVAQFVSWKDILIVVGGAVMAVLIPAVASLVASLAPVIATVAAVIAIVALFRNAWEQDWGGIRTKLTEIWEGQLQPRLAALMNWLKVVLPQALQVLSDFWTNVLRPAMEAVWSWIVNTLIPLWVELSIWLQDTLVAALRTLADFWTNTLLPAITAVWSWMKGTLFPALAELGGWLSDTLTAALSTLAEFWTGTLQPALTAVWDWMTGTLFPTLGELAGWLNDTLTEAAGALAELWTGTLQPAFSAVWDFITGDLLPALGDLAGDLSGALSGAVEGATTLFNGLRDGIGNVIGKISGLIQWVKDLATAVRNFDLGALKALLAMSPPPLAVGIDMVEDSLAGFTRGALREFGRVSAEITPVMPGTDKGAGAPVPRPAPVGGSGGPGQKVTNFYLTAQYKHQSERSLAQEVRLLEQLRS